MSAERGPLTIPANGCTVSHRCAFFKKMSERYANGSPLTVIACGEGREIPQLCPRHPRTILPISIDIESPAPYGRVETEALYPSARRNGSIAEV